MNENLDELIEINNGQYQIKNIEGLNKEEIKSLIQQEKKELEYDETTSFPSFAPACPCFGAYLLRNVLYSGRLYGKRKCKRNRNRKQPITQGDLWHLVLP